jgi:hypothetical protein
MLNEANPECRMALTRQAELKVLWDLPGWNAMQLSVVTAGNPRFSLGYKMKASYVFHNVESKDDFHMMPPQIVRDAPVHPHRNAWSQPRTRSA